MPTQPAASGKVASTPKTALKSSGDVCGVFSRLRRSFRRACRLDERLQRLSELFGRMFGKQMEIDDARAHVAAELDAAANGVGAGLGSGVAATGTWTLKSMPLVRPVRAVRLSRRPTCHFRTSPHGPCR